MQNPAPSERRERHRDLTFAASRQFVDDFHFFKNVKLQTGREILRVRFPKRAFGIDNHCTQTQKRFMDRRIIRGAFAKSQTMQKIVARKHDFGGPALFAAQFH